VSDTKDADFAFFATLPPPFLPCAPPCFVRRDITTAQRAKLVSRRKAAYEAVHLETKQGAAPAKKGKGSGRGKAATTKDPKSGSLVSSFVADTATKTGRS